MLTEIKGANYEIGVASLEPNPIDFSSRTPPSTDASGVVGVGAPVIVRRLGVVFFSCGFGGRPLAMEPDEGPQPEAKAIAAGHTAAD
jgi:hypothetical protein